MNEENIKTSFLKVKEEMNLIKEEISNLKKEIILIKDMIKFTLDEITIKKLKELDNLPLNTPNFKIPISQTNRQINETDLVNKTDNKTVPQEIGGLKYPNFSISTGNEGVKTDKQTNRQTDENSPILGQSIESDIKEASFILDSLDRLKRDIRLKFKRVTDQEMAVFSTIYQLENEYSEDITYQKIAKLLNLSESAIRDYVRRMLLKGIPIKKKKINNKKVTLFISEELKKIANLSTIISLRGL